MAGCFITFEGIEGAGKTTQIHRLAESLREKGKSVCVVREPGGTPVGERLREVLKDTALSGLILPETEFFLFCAGRSELVRSVIRPALKSGKVVLCDRFTDSTLAYQGYGRGLDLDCLRKVIGFSTGGLVPNATIYLDISIETSRRRGSLPELGQLNMDWNGLEDRFENRSSDVFFRRVEAGFRKLAKAEPKRICVVDGRGSEEEVASKVLKNLESGILKSLFERLSVENPTAD